MKLLLSYYTFYFSSAEKRKKSRTLKNLLGFIPCNINLYVQAFTHRSTGQSTLLGNKYNNERLEYLGDAVLDLVIAEMLFKRFPKRDEGFLTEMRSKIVNTNQLNRIGRKMGLDKLLTLDEKNTTIRSYNRSLVADTLEALIGAIYLDRGFKKSKSFIKHRLVRYYLDLDSLADTTINYKSAAFEWAQRNNKALHFEVIDIVREGPRKRFVSELYVDGVANAKGSDFSKKASEQIAAQIFVDEIENGNGTA